MNDDISSLIVIPFVSLAVLMMLAGDIVMIKALCPVGWVIVGLLLIGVWIDQ